MTVSGYHLRAARQRKATALADTLDALDIHVSYVEHLPFIHEFWTNVAEEASRREGHTVNPPYSQATVDEVLAELRRRAEVDLSDPFDFPYAPRDLPTVELPDVNPIRLHNPGEIT